MNYIVGIALLIFLIVIQIIIRIPFKKNKNNFSYTTKNHYVESFQNSFNRCGFPIIQLKINNKFKYFLVDTGASVNMIRDDYFKEIKHIFPEYSDNNSSLSSVSKDIQCKKANIDLKYKDLEFNNEEFLISQLNTFKINKDYYGVDIVGIIGSPLMNKYNWTISFKSLFIYIMKK